jgi:hypothetical protein
MLLTLQMMMMLMRRTKSLEKAASICRKIVDGVLDAL